jgi:predicted RNA binding protein YcfA (HicA-like mRNA interferase family)
LPISRRELIRCLRRLGFEGPESGARHEIMVRGQLRLALPNPHGAQEIGDALLGRILRQAGVTRQELEQARSKRQ